MAASIIATLGIPGHVAPLDKSELKSSTEDGSRDGDIIIRKIRAFLKHKNLPEDKQRFVESTLSNVLLQSGSTSQRTERVSSGVSSSRLSMTWEFTTRLA